MKNNSYMKKTIDCIVISLICGSLSSALLIGMFIPASYYTVLLISLAINILLTIVFLNRQTLIVTLVSAFAFIALILIFAGYRKYFVIASDFFECQLAYLNQYVKNPRYVLSTIIFWTAIIAVLFHLLMIKLRIFHIPFLIGSTLFCVLWILGHENMVHTIWLYAFGCIMLWVDRCERSIIIPAYGTWRLYTLPLAVLVILSAFYFVPGDTHNLKWTALSDTFERINDRISDRYTLYEGSDKYRIDQSGYSFSRIKLGGPVSLNNEIVLMVSSPIPLYLRGSVLDEYTRNSWIYTSDNKQYSFNEKHYNERWIAFDDVERIMYENPLYIKVPFSVMHTGLKSNTIFNAYRTVDISFASGDTIIPYFNTRGETFIKDKIEASIPYNITSMIPRLANEDFIKYVRERSPTLDWRNALPEDLWNEDPSYRSKVELIQKDYIELPISLPGRVYELAYEITEKEETAYDKVIALQKYLRTGFKYTLTPSETPNDRDFVDYFLFDIKEGYCTYFATALAVMARSIGIPSRYVEGFSMPSAPNEQGMYEVRNRNGHAWVEIYFPYVGWLTFDPTPTGQQHPMGAYTNQDDQYWEGFMEDYADAAGENKPPPTPEPYPSPSSKPPEKEETAPPDNEIKDNNRLLQSLWSSLNLKKAGIIASCAIGSILLVTAAFILLKGLFFWRKVRRLSYNKQMHVYYNEILWFMELFGAAIEQGETPYQYAGRIDKWLVNPAGSMMDISELIVTSEFGHHQVTIDDILRIKAFYTRLKQDIVKISGLPKVKVLEILRLYTDQRLHKKT